MELDEKLIEMKEKKMTEEAEFYFDKYKNSMNVLDKTLVGKVRSITPYDVYAVGKMLEAFDIYKKICEEDGNVNQLGKIPDIAYDVITIAYGSSIIPFVASVQPIGEERGTVYFKNVKADTAKGNMSAGETIFAPQTFNTPQGFANNYYEGESAGNTSSGDTTYSHTTAAHPIKRSSVTVTIATSTPIVGVDNGEGYIVGNGVYGNVDYDTGDIDITLISDPAGTYAITVDYQINYEQQTDLPKIRLFFDNAPILARVYALKGTIGMLQAFGMKTRFGMVAEDELAKDLVAEINAEIGGDIIRAMYAQAQGNTNWSKVSPSGVSYFEHKQTFKDALADSEAVIVGNAGRGTINTLIAGRGAASIISTLPGFTKLTDGTTLGAHVFGTLDGVTVIRVNESAILGSNYVIPIWKGMSPFEAPVVYAPYMPLIVTSTLPLTNPLLQQRAAAVWAGVKVVVNKFITKLTITNM